MSKKIIVQGRVVKAPKWVIDYTVTNLQTGETSRHRQDFGLNSVPDLDLRQKIADHICTNIEAIVLPRSKKEATNAQDQPATDRDRGPSLQICIDEALKVKHNKSRVDTYKSYRNISNNLFRYLETRAGGSAASIAKFTAKDAQKFFDWLRQTKPYSNTTINNHLIILKSLWSEIILRTDGVQNVWKGIEKARQIPKTRRAFTPEEKRIVAKHIELKDYYLFRAILLQYYCYIRPSEITRLKFSDFDFCAGTVTIPEQSAKSWKRRVVTIPISVMPYFCDGSFNTKPSQLFCFGRGWVPGTKHISRDQMYRRHQKYLQHLVRVGQLENIEGLTWYSWKDTGITEHIHSTTPVATRNQAGHHDLDMTMRYYEQDKVNAEYKDLPNSIFNE